jgi:putative transcription antitermination factor YqgF
MFDTIAIDWGEKICGVAFGDSKSKLCIPSTDKVENSRALSYITQQIEKRCLKLIVVGMPVNFHGGNTIVTMKVQEFIALLQESHPHIDIQTINERGTTQMAQKKIAELQKYQYDNQAACEILLDFFRYYKNGKHSDL